MCTWESWEGRQKNFLERNETVINEGRYSICEDYKKEPKWRVFDQLKCYMILKQNKTKQNKIYGM